MSQPDVAARAGGCIRADPGARVLTASLHHPPSLMLPSMIPPKKHMPPILLSPRPLQRRFWHTSTAGGVVS